MLQFLTNQVNGEIIAKKNKIIAIFIITILVFSQDAFAFETRNLFANMTDKIVFAANFDKTIAVDTPLEVSFEKNGGKIITDGVIGGALRLNKGEYLSIEANPFLSQTEGTVMFWLRPHWNYNMETSHTFLSHKWADKRNGYFVLSDGWWETGGGAPYTYLIYNNQDSIKTNQVVNFKKGDWVFVAYTWKNGIQSYVKLFINDSFGRLLGNHPIKLYTPEGKLYIGTDKGTPLSKNRWGDFDIDEFVILNKALPDIKIKSIYSTLNPQKKTENSKHVAKTSRTSPPRIRAIFDEEDTWTTKIGAQRIIKKIKEAGFNVYIPCVWHGRGTRYISNIAPMEKKLEGISTDPLSYLIMIAHKNNIEIHPWFTVALRRRDFYKEYYDFGTPKDAFDLHKKEFRKFIVSMIIEVVKKYDVDGVNLDYIRTMGICKSISCSEDYFKKYNRNLLKDLLYKSESGNLEPHVQEWLDLAVEDVVKTVSEQAKLIKPGFIISVDGVVQPNLKIYNRQGRQEIPWANKGYIDIIYSMDYNSVPDFERLQMSQEFLNDKNKLVPLLGNYKGDSQGKIISRDIELIRTAVHQSLSKFPNGIGLYWYRSLNKEQIIMLKEGPFKSENKSP